MNRNMYSMAKYSSEVDQEEIDRSRKEHLAFEKELFEQKLKVRPGTGS